MGKRIQRAKTRRVILCVGAWLAVLSGAGPVVAATGGGVVTGTVTLGAGAAGARLEDVIVSIEGLHLPVTDGNVPAPAALVLDQKDLTFVPHVLPVPAGVSVTFHNNDAVLHNVHSVSTLNPVFNFGMMKGSTKTKTFEHPEVVKIQCDVHSEMSAVILVKDNPFYARPASNGRFTIAGIPAGTYTIRAWHEKAGAVDQPVAVSDSGTTTVSLAVGK